MELIRGRAYCFASLIRMLKSSFKRSASVLRNFSAVIEAFTTSGTPWHSWSNCKLWQRRSGRVTLKARLRDVQRLIPDLNGDLLDTDRSRALAAPVILRKLNFPISGTPSHFTFTIIVPTL